MTTTHHHQPITSPEVAGVGHSRRRVEDDRLIQGRGNFVDDVVLPGMLHMEIVRSPLAHAKILEDMGQAADVANAVAFLASDKAAYITGETLHVNGGLYMG